MSGLVIIDSGGANLASVRQALLRLGVDAPRSVPVYREEIWTAVRAENEAAASGTELPAAPAAPPDQA